MLTLDVIFRTSVSQFAQRPALGFAGEKPMSYQELGEKAEAFQSLLRLHRINKGDRVAILGQNMPNWAVAYFAVTTMGAVAVPILPDFSTEEIKNILEHSGANGLVISERLEYKLTGFEHPGLVIGMDELTVKEFRGERNESYRNEKLTPPVADDLASIIYTSGTTGRSKGVMLSHQNIASNARDVLSIQAVNEEDVFLSVLPLSHTYENTLGLVLPVRQGASIYYLLRPPTAQVLLPALEVVRPTTMLTVPMIMEKIYRNQILGKFSSGVILPVLYRIPPFRILFHRLAGRKLKATFGGRLRFFGIGGARLDEQVERFLREAKFPYAIGYGLTETSPLIAGANPAKTRLRSTGPVMQGVRVRLEGADPKTGIGEIVAKGENVMMGYYREPELTSQVLGKDGWLRTGDLGSFDRNGNLYIRGRSKTMILSATGENIYPEDIESVINNFRYVVESLVIQKKGKLVALVHIDTESLQNQVSHLKEEAVLFVQHRVENLKKELLDYVNSRVNRYSRLQGIELMPSPFEKTPTLKIKRYLYSPH